MQLTSFFLVKLFLSTFHEGDDITHAEDTVGHTFRIEHVECVHLLTDTDKLDRLLHHGADGQGSTTAGVAVQLGKHHTIEVEAIVEGLSGIHGILTRHGIDHKQGLMRMHGFFNLGNLVHHLLVNSQTASGIDDDYALVLGLGVLDGMLCNLHGILVAVFAINLHFHLLAQDLQLVNSSRTIHVTSHQQHLLALLAFQVVG